MKIVRASQVLPWMRIQKIPTRPMINEDTNNVGRKYQHIEDLVLSHGKSNFSTSR